MSRPDITNAVNMKPRTSCLHATADCMGNFIMINCLLWLQWILSLSRTGRCEIRDVLINTGKQGVHIPINLPAKYKQDLRQYALPTLPLPYSFRPYPRPYPQPPPAAPSVPKYNSFFMSYIRGHRHFGYFSSQGVNYEGLLRTFAFLDRNKYHAKYNLKQRSNTSEF